jgi:preprotein translocase SecF subunit
MIYFEFIKNRFYFYAFSAVIFLGTPLLLMVRPLNLGLDFVGGTEFLIRFEKAVDEEKIRHKLESAEFRKALGGGDLGDVTVYKVVNPNEGQPGPAGGAHYSIRTKMQPDAIRGIEEKLIKGISDLGRAERLATNSIGPVVGKSLKINAYKAIFWSCVVILMYMWFRFELRPGITCTLALLHDACTILILFALTHGEVDLTVVAAILTVLGYSMNDSIVILDRIRENLRLKRKMPYDELVNLSVNQCLSRTLYTGCTVVLTLFTLLLMGPPVLHNFSLAMTIGVLSGTISTVSVVTPLLVDWHNLDRARA